MGTTQANLLMAVPVSVQIMTFVGGSSQFPHTFLEVKDANGNIYDFGLAPQQQGQPYSLGEIYNDANHPFTSSSGPITLTANQGIPSTTGDGAQLILMCD